MKLIDKKNIFLFFCSLIIIMFLSQYSLKNLCPVNVIGNSCSELFYMIRNVAHILVYFIGIVLLVLPLPYIVFTRWKKFALWAVPILTFLIVWIEKTGSSGGLPGQFHPGLIFFPLIFAFYYTVSLTIILGAWYEAKTNKKPKWWQYLVLIVILAGVCVVGFFGLVVLALR